MIRNGKLLALCALLVLLLTGCSSKEPAAQSSSSAAPAPTQSLKAAEDLLYKVSTLDYTLYMNIYYNDMASKYVNTKMNTSGTFISLEDRFSNRTRYYVWGYLDETKCCDWQWELSLPEGAELPENGSLVKVSGKFTEDPNALDSYWLTDVSMTTETVHAPGKADVDMSVMNGTLERVQLLNMQYFPETFEGQTVCLYGRVESPTSIQHPYYDGAWSQEFKTTDTVPAIGSTVLVTGTFSGGTIVDAKVELTTQYY